MSDTEDEGAFDREAEKEKLREQLAREEEDRRSTRHMSELLLKGATMTNKHCDTCGDPLFRYEGQEFCPTCSRDGGEAATQPSPEEGSGGESDDGADGGSTAGADRQSVETGRDAAGRGSTGIDRVEADSTPETAEAGVTDPRGTPTAAASEPGTAPSGPETATPAEADVGEAVADARAALARKLSVLARQAEATDDVGRARELLAAAREAAEALAAIDRIGR